MLYDAFAKYTKSYLIKIILTTLGEAEICEKYEVAKTDQTLKGFVPEFIICIANNS